MASYPFRDTTAQAAPEGGYPAEALRLSGTWLEDIVPGYRTLWVRGRELLAPDLETETVGTRDGVLLLSRRYLERTITVGYQLIAADAAAFRSAYNKLAAALDVQQAECVFADEPDKYFTGTPSGVGQVEDGRSAVTGEFSILCDDPCKYSLTEYEVAPETLANGGSVSISYHGTYRSFPVLEAAFATEAEGADGSLTGAGDCGFVMFQDAGGHVIQLGRPDEADGEDLPKSQTLINQVFADWDAAAAGRWTANDGRVWGRYQQTGTVAAHDIGNRDGDTLLHAGSYGTYAGGWHGPSISRTLPADQAGSQGAENWTVTWRQLFGIGQAQSAVRQLGMFQCMLSDSDDRLVAGVTIWKISAGNTARIRFCVADSTQVATEDVSVDASYYNLNWGWTQGTGGSTPVRTNTIRKSGNTVYFQIGGIKRECSNPALEGMTVTRITLFFGQYGTTAPLSLNDLYWVKFVKDNCDTWRDIPNTFTANDVVTVDCADGGIRRNNAPAPELGALGNDYEHFCLTAGENQIGAAWSDWVPDAYRPKISIRYREVWL